MKAKTAVILAGGRGERLQPLTHTLPKALAPVDGVPMLKKLIQQLCALGFQRVLVLAGHLAQNIKHYCDTLDFDLDLVVIQSPPELSPAHRLLNSRSEIGNSFFLLYCDNFVDDEFGISLVLKSDAPLTFFIEYRNEGNIRVEDNGRAIYSFGERSHQRRGVELGYMLVNYPLFFEVLDKIQDLGRTLEFLSDKLHCSYVESRKRLVSNSTFKSFRANNVNRNIIALDRDGVLLERVAPREYITNWNQYNPIDDSWKALEELASYGFDFIIATNQPGVALGQVSQEFLQDLHAAMTRDLLSRGVNVLAFYVCPHHWNLNCECRKPMPGMLLNAINDFSLPLMSTTYVGDEERDYDAAIRANMIPLLIGSNHSLSFNFPTLTTALPTILASYGKLPR